MAALDDEADRQRLLASLRAGASLTVACSGVGTSRRTLRNVMERDPDFAEDVQRAQDAGRPTLERRAAQREQRRMLDVRLESESPVVAEARAEMARAEPSRPVHKIPTRDEFLAWCWQTAQDPDHRSGPKCTHVLAEYLLGGEVQLARMRAQRAAERETDASRGEVGVVLVELPVNGTEAEGHEPRPAARSLVLDVEVESRGLDS